MLKAFKRSLFCIGGLVLLSSVPTRAEITGTRTPPGGSSTNVQYNKRGDFAGSTDLTFSTTNNRTVIFAPPQGSTTSFASCCSSATHVGRILLSTNSPTGTWMYVCESSGNWVAQSVNSASFQTISSAALTYAQLSAVDNLDQTISSAAITYTQLSTVDNLKQTISSSALTYTQLLDRSSASVTYVLVNGIGALNGLTVATSSMTLIELTAGSIPVFDSNTREWSLSAKGAQHDGFQHYFNVGSVNRSTAVVINSGGQVQITTGTSSAPSYSYMGNTSAGWNPETTGQNYYINGFTAIKVSSSNGGVSIRASTGPSTSVGDVGESTIAFNSGVTPAATGNFTNVSNLDLDPGYWTLTGGVQAEAITTVTRLIVAISTNSGNGQNDQVVGYNNIEMSVPTVAARGGGTVSNWEVHIATKTRIYLKALVSYTGSPSLTGNLRGERH